MKYYTKLTKNNTARGCFLKNIHKNENFENLVEIPKDIWDRHRKICKQQYINGQWFDYIATSKERKDDLSKKLYKLLKEKRKILLKNLSISLDIDNKKVFISADSNSISRLAIKSQLLDDDSATLEWIGTDNDIYLLTRQDIKELIRVADFENSKLVLKFRKLLNSLKDKSLSELEKLKEDLINGK